MSNPASLSKRPSRSMGQSLRRRFATPKMFLHILWGVVVFIEFLQDYSTYQKGAVVDLPDRIARGYIEESCARESNAQKHLESIMQAEISKMTRGIDEQLEKVRTAMVPAAAASQPPATNGVSTNPDGSLNVPGRITPGEASIERGSKDFGDICRCIYYEHMGDPRARERLAKVYNLSRNPWVNADGSPVMRTGTEGNLPTYGYLVRPEYLGNIFQIMQEQSVMSGMTQIPVGQAISVHYPAFDQYNNPAAGASSYHAGVLLYRKDEVAQRTQSDALLADIPFTITDLTGMTSVSRDLIADSFVSIDAMLRGLFSRAFAWRCDYDYLRGTGTGEPQGIFGAACTIVGGPATNKRGAANKISSDDLIWMYSKLHSSCENGAVWIANTSCRTQLTILANAAGTPVYQPNSSVTQSERPAQMLLGFPVRYTEKVPVLGATGDITLAHPPSYGEAMRQGVEIAISEHFYFDTDKVAYKWKLRNDGKPLWKGTFKQADGSNTAVSCFIQLATF